MQSARASNLAVADELPQRSPGTASAGARARRASRAREAHDGWTFVLIPPGAGARPRTLRISVRRLRMVTAALVTVVATGVVSGSLLAVLLSMPPSIQPETAGVRLGVFAGEDLPLSASGDSMSAMPYAATPAGGVGNAAGAALDAATGESSFMGPSRAAERNTATASAPSRVTERRSTSRRRSSGGRADGATVAEARAHGLPVIGRITSRFSNARRHPLLGVVRRHNGVDIAAPSGTPITAAAAGRVIFAGRKFGFGNTVEIDHGHGVITRYAHARSIKVRGGARVESGKTIATVGRTGLASGPHLHFEVLVNGISVDPLKRSVSSLLGGSSSEEAPEAPEAPAPGATAVPSLGTADSSTRVAVDSGGAALPPTPGPVAPTGGAEGSGAER